MADLKWNDLDKRKFYGLMPLGSMAIRALVYPLQLVKTRLQAQSLYTGTWHAFKTIVGTEGVRALYRGFWTNSFGIVVGPVYITTLELARHRWEMINDEHKLVANLFIADKLVGPLCGGAVASLAAQTLMVPVDILTQHQMVALTEKRRPPGPIDIGRRILRTQGVKGMFRGYGISVALYVPGSGITWSTYHMSRHAMLGSACAALRIDDAEQLPAIVRYGSVPLAGMCGGSLSASLTNPLDVIRTRMQLEDSSTASIRGTVRQLLQESGYRGFLRGISARVLSSGSSMAIVMSFYESVKNISRIDQTV
jgi:solute carrier family 25, member 44